MDTKQCKVCRQVLPLDSFYSRGGKRAHQKNSYCKACHTRMTKENRRRNPERYAAYRRKYEAARTLREPTWKRNGRIKQKYGVTQEEYEWLASFQFGACAICRRVPTDSHGLCIDHDHVTGRIRGLLCNHCNRAIGLMDEDPNALFNASRYVQ